MCAVSALLPKTQYWGSVSIKCCFLCWSTIITRCHSIVCGDFVSPTTLSREVFATALLFVSMVLRPQCSQCWYWFAKSAMDFFGCCMPTKNSLTVQDSVIFFFLVNVALVQVYHTLSTGTTGAIKIRWVLIDWRRETPCQLSLLLLHALDFVGEMPFDSMPGQFSDQVEDITPLNSRQQVYIFVVPSTDLLYVRLNVGCWLPMWEDFQECYLSSTPIAMMRKSARVQTNVIPCLSMMLPPTSSCHPTLCDLTTVT